MQMLLWSVEASLLAVEVALGEVLVVVEAQELANPLAQLPASLAVAAVVVEVVVVVAVAEVVVEGEVVEVVGVEAVEAEA